MRNRFDSQLDQLNVELIKMGALCEEAISAAVKSFLDGDDSLAEKVYRVDGEIDQAEHDIETLCIKLLLRQQPVASDLRVISSALKMISDMERIGDQASDIAEIAVYLPAGNAKSIPHISEMARATIKMVTDSGESFVKKDLALARQVMAYDDRVDELFVRVRGELVESVKTEAEKGEYWIDLLMIAKYLERIGDHAVNVAEWVEYSITGLHSNSEEQPQK